MKKKQIIKFIKIIFVAAICIFILNIIVKFLIVQFGSYSLNSRLYNGMVTNFTEIQADSELSRALEWYNNWDNIFITDDFKNKFKNRKNIIEDIDNYKNISGHFESEGENKYIVIYADKKKNLIELLNPNAEDIATEFYFKYKLDEKNWLDDVELIRIINIDSATAEEVGRQDYNEDYTE